MDHMHMPADCLTKYPGRAETLKHILTEGEFGITSEAATLAERLDVRRAQGYIVARSFDQRRFLDAVNKHGCVMHLVETCNALEKHRRQFAVPFSHFGTTSAGSC